jgi:23S rRNA pseudouridine955/2504/2580 synthase
MRELGLRRLFLHAHHLGVTLPDETELSVSAPLEPGLQAVIDRLEELHG